MFTLHSGYNPLCTEVVTSHVSIAVQWGKDFQTAIINASSAALSQQNPGLLESKKSSASLAQRSLPFLVFYKALSPRDLAKEKGWGRQMGNIEK